MKHHNKTLLELRFLVELSKTGTTASCHAAEFHGTKVYAQESVARHRAISADVRRSVLDLLADLDRYDAEVEKYFSEVHALKLEGTE